MHVDINDPNSDAFRTLKYLCELGRGDPNARFLIRSVCADLEIPERTGQSVFAYLVGKGFARYMGLSKGGVVPTDAGFRQMERALGREQQ